MRKGWTTEEESILIDYLVEIAKMNREKIEKPTRNQFWKKFLEKTGVDRTVEQVKRNCHFLHTLICHFATPLYTQKKSIHFRF